MTRGLGQRECPLLRELLQAALANLIPTLLERCQQGTANLLKDGQEVRLSVGDKQVLRLQLGSEADDNAQPT